MLVGKKYMKCQVTDTKAKDRKPYELLKHDSDTVKSLSIRACVIKRLQSPSASAVIALVHTNYLSLVKFRSVFPTLLTTVILQPPIMSHDPQTLSDERLAVGVDN